MDLDKSYWSTGYSGSKQIKGSDGTLSLVIIQNQKSNKTIKTILAVDLMKQKNILGI